MGAIAHHQALSIQASAVYLARCRAGNKFLPGDQPRRPSHWTRGEHLRLDCGSHHKGETVGQSTFLQYLSMLSHILCTESRPAEQH